MKISYNWLKSYINLDIETEKIGNILTDIGLEVGGIESFQSVQGGLEGLVIGSVVGKEKHPNADKLSVCLVDTGEESLLNIVCGAPNVETGQKVVVAVIGSTLYMNNGETLIIKRSKIRGIESQGMICAEDEIGLGDSHDGILVLDQNASVGMPANEYFQIENDTIFDIDLTPNRIDGASHFGVARDLAAYFRNDDKIQLNKVPVDEFVVDHNNLIVDIKIDNHEACPRYSGITLTDLEIKESPDWLKNRLKSIGLKPINNVVDATNYVLHETGQPLHAFDIDKIDGRKIIVQTLPDKAKFITLDETERELSNNDLMICNENEGMCIAGVFGGIKSGVTNSTKSIFIESAYFNPVWVRKTAKRHGLNTDSSFRFERGADANATVYALKRAALLIKELANGKISSEIVDIYPNPLKNRMIELSFSSVHHIIGNEIDKEIIKEILSALDIKIIAEKEISLLLEIPSYRVDVTREADIIEEILRIYGYNNVKISSQVKSSIQYSAKPDKEKIRNQISDMLCGAGFNEMMSNSLTKSTYYEGNTTYKADNLVKIFNPLSYDLNCMRQTLLYGGIEAIAHNVNRKNTDLHFFEFGNCYFNNNLKNNKYAEEVHLSLFIAGNKTESNWAIKASLSNFYTIKSYVNNILVRIGLNIDQIAEKNINNDIFSEGIQYFYKDNLICEFGIIDNTIIKMFGLSEVVYYADLQWGKITNLIKDIDIQFDMLPKYPEVKRDLALLLDKSILFKDLKAAAYKIENKLLKSVSLFDVYEGENISNDKKSYAISFVIQDHNKTLTDKQVDKIINKLMKHFIDEYNAQIR